MLSKQRTHNGPTTTKKGAIIKKAIAVRESASRQQPDGQVVNQTSQTAFFFPPSLILIH
jgi:ribosomal protein L14